MRNEIIEININENKITSATYGSDIQNIDILHWFEDYIKNTELVIKSIQQFLGLNEETHFDDQPKGSYRIPKNFTSKILLDNKSFRKLSTFFIPTVTRQKLGDKYFLKEAKKPKMPDSERKYLKELYYNEVIQLEKFLGKKLPWDDFN